MLPSILAITIAALVPGTPVPTLCFDEAHHNVHTSSGRYSAFVDLAEEEGYRVLPLTRAWTASELQGCDLLATASPRGAGRERSLQERGAAAFSEAEAGALSEWILTGGGFLLITDHPPIGSACKPLASRLGIDMSHGFTEDPEHADAEAGFLVFSRQNGRLASHPITDGSGPEERVDRVVTYLGQSLAPPDGGANLLDLGPNAVDRFRRSTDRLWLEPSPEDRVSPAAGRSQAIAFALGSGRIVALADAAMLTGFGKNSGFDTEGADNRQFARNVLRWLSKEL